MPEYTKELLVAAALQASNMGMGEEYIAQLMTSSIGSAGLSPADAIEYIADIVARVANLLGSDDYGVLWEGLMPGPPSTLKMKTMIDNVENLAEHGPVASMYRPGIVTSGIVTSEGLQMEEPVKAPKFNIKLAYGLHVFTSDGENSTSAYWCPNGAEFFLDEHNVQWVKFSPANGYKIGKEHIVRTDSLGFTVVKA